MVIVKIITKTFYYSKAEDNLFLENEEVSYVRTSPVDAMDLIEECNTNVTEGENYRRYKTGDYRLTTCYATL